MTEERINKSKYHEFKPIAHIETDFNTKFAIPRQSGLIEELEGRVVFEKEYQNPDAVRGLSEYSHIWLLWQFSENLRECWSPTVRPPKLGGNTRVGVFASRSPFRPNPIGLSCVKLKEVRIDEEQGPVLYVCGVDMMNGTPIYDIKPYLPYADAYHGAKAGFTESLSMKPLAIKFNSSEEEKVPENKRKVLRAILEQDPRPAYHDEPERVYGFEFAGLEIKFMVQNGVLNVVKVEKKM